MTIDEAKEVYKNGRKLQDTIRKASIAHDDLSYARDKLPERGRRALGEIESAMFMLEDQVKAVLGSLEDEFGPGLDSD